MCTGWDWCMVKCAGDWILANPAKSWGAVVFIVTTSLAIWRWYRTKLISRLAWQVHQHAAKATAGVHGNTLYFSDGSLMNALGKHRKWFPEVMQYMQTQQTARKENHGWVIH